MHPRTRICNRDLRRKRSPPAPNEYLSLYYEFISTQQVKDTVDQQHQLIIYLQVKHFIPGGCESLVFSLSLKSGIDQLEDAVGIAFASNICSC